jgi:polygalacturonase
MVNVPSEDILIEHCVMRVKYGAITLGSDMTGGVRNVFARDCTIGGPSLYFGLYIKTNSIRGGFAENIYLKDIEISNLTKEVVQCNFHRGEGDTGPLTPVVRNIELRNITVHHARNALMLRGYRRSPIQDFRLIDCTFTVDSPSTIHHAIPTFDNVVVNTHPITNVHQLR